MIPAVRRGADGGAGRRVFLIAVHVRCSVWALCGIAVCCAVCLPCRLFFASQQSFGEISHGIPHGYEADGEHRDEHHGNVFRMDAYRISVDNE